MAATACPPPPDGTSPAAVSWATSESRPTGPAGRNVAARCLFCNELVSNGVLPAGARGSNRTAAFDPRLQCACERSALAVEQEVAQHPGEHERDEYDDEPAHSDAIEQAEHNRE